MCVILAPSGPLGTPSGTMAASTAKNSMELAASAMTESFFRQVAVSNTFALFTGIEFSYALFHLDREVQ